MTSVNVTFQPSQVLPGEEALCIKNTGCSLAWRRGQRRLPSGKVKNVLRPLDVEGPVSRGEGGVGQAQRVWQCLWRTKSSQWGDFPGGPGAQGPSSQRRGPGSIPWSESWIPHAATKDPACHSGDQRPRWRQLRPGAARWINHKGKKPPVWLGPRQQRGGGAWRGRASQASVAFYVHFEWKWGSEWRQHDQIYLLQRSFWKPLKSRGQGQGWLKLINRSCAVVQGGDDARWQGQWGEAEMWVTWGGQRPRDCLCTAGGGGRVSRFSSLPTPEGDGTLYRDSSM